MDSHIIRILSRNSGRRRSLTIKYIAVGYQLSPALSLSKGPSAAAVSQTALPLRAELETFANLNLLSKIGGESFGQ